KKLALRDITCRPFQTIACDAITSWYTETNLQSTVAMLGTFVRRDHSLGQVSNEARAVAMPSIGKNPDRDFSAGEPPRPHIDRSCLDAAVGAGPLSYVESLTDPTVQSRLAKLIGHPTHKRQPKSRRARHYPPTNPTPPQSPPFSPRHRMLRSRRNAGGII